MSAMSKRLLEQHGGDVSQVIVVAEAAHNTGSPPETKPPISSKIEAKATAILPTATASHQLTSSPTPAPKVVTSIPTAFPKTDFKPVIAAPVISQTPATPSAGAGFFSKVFGSKNSSTSYPPVSTPQTRSPASSSLQSPADAKAQSLLKELYALVNEVYPANDSTVAEQRSGYLAKLKPFQDRQARLTLADRGKLRALQTELEEAQEATAAVSLG
jgi:hypothetical protein